MRFFYLLLCFLLLFYANYKGLGITYDSQNYLHAAKTFQEKGILLNKDNTIFNQQPPLFPVILSCFLSENQSFVFYFNVFQVICFLSIVYIWLLYAKRLFEQFVIFYHLFAFSLCCATPLYLVHHFVWSEPFFVLLLSIDVYIFQKFLVKAQNGYFDRQMIFMIILGFLYSLQRNTGVFFIFAKIICYLIYRKDVFYKKIFLQIFYGFFSSFGWIIWFLVVYFLSEHSTDAQVLGHFSWNINISQIFFYNGKDILVSFSAYFFPLPIVEKGGVLLKFFVLCVLFSLFFFAKKTRIFGLITLIYTSLLLLFVPDFSDAERYLAVIYPLFLILLYENLKELFVFLSSKTFFLYQILVIVLFGFIFYFQVYHLWRVCKNVHFYQEKKSDITITIHQQMVLYLCLFGEDTKQRDIKQGKG